MRLTILAVVMSCSVAVAQQTITIASDPNDLSRPISTLLDQVRDREHLAVTYEDPTYSHTPDVEDVTERIARSSSTQGHRTIVPRGRAITFVYKAGDFRTQQLAEVTIARMLREYRMLGGPSFSVMRHGGRLHVVPAEVLGAEWNRIPQTSILDTVIAVPSAPRDGGQLLQAICDEIKKQTGHEVGIGPSVPSNNLHEYRAAESIEHMSARSALEQLLDKSSLPGGFVWDLYYDPGDMSYGLNFSFVPSKGPVAKAN